jgi:hypothetical protein
MTDQVGTLISDKTVASPRTGTHSNVLSPSVAFAHLKYISPHWPRRDQGDIEAASLNGDPEEIIHLEPPEGGNIPTNKSYSCASHCKALNQWR